MSALGGDRERSFEVIVQAGMTPGQKVKVKMPDGREVIVTIPVDAVAGQSFRVGKPTAVKAKQLPEPEPARVGRSRASTHTYGSRGGLVDLAARGDAAGVRAALAAGADPDAVEGGWFALAAAAQHCFSDCMEALLIGGANPNQVFEQTERSAAMLCADMDVELGATVESPCRALAVLASHGADLTARDAGGDSAATLAAGSADSQSLALLCALGVDMQQSSGYQAILQLRAIQRSSLTVCLRSQTRGTRRRSCSPPSAARWPAWRCCSATSARWRRSGPTRR